MKGAARRQSAHWRRRCASEIDDVGALHERLHELATLVPIGAIHELATSEPVGVLHEMTTLVRSTKWRRRCTSRNGDVDARRRNPRNGDVDVLDEMTMQCRHAPRIGGVVALHELATSVPVGALHEIATSVPVGALHELATSMRSIVKMATSVRFTTWQLWCASRLATSMHCCNWRRRCAS